MQHHTENTKLLQIPLFTDNYSYAIVDESSRSAVVVDPADAKVFQSFFTKRTIQSHRNSYNTPSLVFKPY